MFTLRPYKSEGLSKGQKNLYHKYEKEYITNLNGF